MAVDPSVIAALEAALRSDEGNLGVRIHLAQLLVYAGRNDEALDHAAAILSSRPYDAAALRIAAAAADSVGDTARADSYRRLLTGLGPGHDAPDPRPRATSAGVPADGAKAADYPDSAPMPDTADELLERWGDSEATAETEIGSLSRPLVTLRDVGGMDDVKRRLELSFLAPLRHPELRVRFGKSLRGGLLMWGPPGCGKTFVARALAGELGASFYEIGLSDVLDMWIGQSEKNLHATFEVARRNRPCLLFFDEIDALGHKRSQLRAGGTAMRGVVNQLLAELDGATSDNEGVFVLAASNHPWDIDEALLRPGRFDRSILVLPPGRDAREAILSFHLRDKPVEAIDLRKIAKVTEGCSGADLALICEHATERAMEASMLAGAISPIRQDDLMAAASDVRSSVGTWLETARNFAMYSNESGAYDELAAYLKKRRR